MKNLIRRGTALGLALTMTITAASASNALGWDLHKTSTPVSQGTTLETGRFWSDTYSDLRAEYYVSYAPNENVAPAVSYGDYITSKATLSAMAGSLEGQGKRVVSGLNGDWYVVATGATTGLVITDGVVRATPYFASAWAIGFREDGTAFIGQPGIRTTVTFGGQERRLTGAINKVRKTLASDGTGGLTLLTDDFAATTQNTQPGVDVILVPADDGSGQYAAELKINQKTRAVCRGAQDRPKDPLRGGAGAGVHRQHRHPRGEGGAHPQRRGRRQPAGRPAGPPAGGRGGPLRHR